MIPVLLLILLLTMPSLSIQGASNGLLLWFHVVLPTLAPFMICTQLVTMFGGIDILMRPFAPIFHRIFGLDTSGGYVLLCGLLCGYPLGAKLCADFYRRGQISKEDANYLLSICNHPSPMFLLGYVKNQLPAGIPVFLIPLCLYLPIFPISLLSRWFYKKRNRTSCRNVTDGANLISVQTSSITKSNARSLSLEEILMSTCDTMVVIGGYIMLFSILTAWIGVLPFLPETAKALLSGFAEITTGIHQICSCKTSASPLLPVIAAVSFGGLSGIFQTRSVIRVNESDLQTDTFSACPGNAKNAGLSIRHYIIWKLLHASFSCITLFLLQPVLLP
ncbi:MAG: nucleoside recognition protein [Brotaphodocola sp.]